MALGDIWICICGSLMVALQLLGSFGDALAAYM
jgi:hypothetical protein